MLSRYYFEFFRHTTTSRFSIRAIRSTHKWGRFPRRSATVLKFATKNEDFSATISQPLPVLPFSRLSVIVPNCIEFNAVVKLHFIPPASRPSIRLAGPHNPHNQPPQNLQTHRMALIGSYNISEEHAWACKNDPTYGNETEVP